jgi:hypothetical protein
MKSDNISFARVEGFKYLGKTLNKTKLYSGRNKKMTEVRECLLSFCVEYFVFHFASPQRKL